MFFIAFHIKKLKKYREVYTNDEEIYNKEKLNEIEYSQRLKAKLQNVFEKKNTIKMQKVRVKRACDYRNSVTIKNIRRFHSSGEN